MLNGGSDYGTIEEAIRVIKKGPRWKPGIQNGIQVKSTKKQKITFVITED
jgi:protein TonB